MNHDDKLKRLLRIARSVPADEKVPLAFEQRIMARLAEPPRVDPSDVWSRVFWRVAAGCLGVVLIVAIWSAVAPKPASSTQDLANDLEKTILAPFGSLARPW